MTTNIDTLRRFISPGQLQTMIDLTRGEEGEHFQTSIDGWAGMINIMPKTYEQSDKGDDAIVYLHYFSGGADWYITEKDIGDGTDDDGQHQAFGLANLGYGGELGYISINELIENRVEFDLYWDLKTLAEVKALNS